MEKKMISETKFHPLKNRQFTDHPKFSGVKIAVLVTGRDTSAVSVSQLLIEPGIAIPIHTHAPQVDSIMVVSGQGEGYVNGEWQKIQTGDYFLVPAEIEHGVKNTGTDPLVLFVHHSPPLL